MKVAMDMLCRTFSRALDIIEEEQIGASDRHSMRISALCAAMGKKLGYDDDALTALANCALFHDNALTEHHLSERDHVLKKQNMILHCEKGQSNVSWLPFKKSIDGIILYHHEIGNGQGPFRKKEGEYPFEAAILAAADYVDVKYRLQHLPPKELAGLREIISAKAEAFSTRAAIDLLLETLDSDMLESLRDENIAQTLNNSLPRWELDISEISVICIAGFIAHVVDHKSRFTRKHTSQIANRAWLMGARYGYSQTEQAALYLAASLHDIGKMATPIEILEKPGRLDEREFQIIKEHSRNTHNLLCDIPDFDLIKHWAADHHEKLDGTGYAFGKKGDELDFNTRLIACLDIYQAVSEARPYHEARTHAETMPVLYEMAAKGYIDSGIVKDINEVMEEYSMKDIPQPGGGNAKAKCAAYSAAVVM